MNPGTLLLGPLAGPECRRALARGWLIVLRTLAASVLMGPAVIAIWYWWFNRDFDETFQPFNTLRVALLIVTGMATTIALVMAPAVLAGSLAGEKERGALGLLLTTRVSTREIILGRVLGKLSQVAMVLLASLPAASLLAVLSGMRPRTQLVLWALPAAVAFGGAGLAAAASTLARRGRDALLVVYLFFVIFLLAPLLSYTSLVVQATSILGALNPFVGILPLVWDEQLDLVLISIGLWLVLGLLGVLIAAWRLRPACLGPLSGDRIQRFGKRRGWVPPLDERPMLWKELFIERVGTLGRAGRWLGMLYVLFMGGGSLLLSALYAYKIWDHLDPAWAHDTLELMTQPGKVLWVFSWSWILELAIGLRAAATIASERERSTWDAILTSPLDGGEIVLGKLWGSLFALRWIVGATFLAWTLAVACDAMPMSEYASLVVQTLVVGCFMAAVGVRASLAVSTASQATAWTIGVWLGGWVVDATVSGILLSVLGLLWLFTWVLAAQMGFGTMATLPSPPISTALLWAILSNGTFIVTTLLIVSDTRLRFDRIAGRMTEGRVSVVLDRMLYGGPAAPVLMDDLAPAPTPVVADKSGGTSDPLREAITSE